jgi:hypothetical protein
MKSILPNSILEIFLFVFILIKEIEIFNSSLILVLFERTKNKEYNSKYLL